jgi:hypothetical protein
MKLSHRLRNHRWKSGSMTPAEHGWDYNDDPIKAADLLDRLESLLHDLPPTISESKLFNDRIQERVRLLLAELEGRSVNTVVTAFYILEDSKQRPLPLNVDEAIEILREEFIAGHTHGTLCIRGASGRDEGDVIKAQGEHDWAAFEFKARAWLARAINLSLVRQDN